MTAVQLAIGALTLLTNAFFVGAEFALISVRRSQIEPQAVQGSRRARSALWGLEHLSAAMATAQLGITISSLVLGAVAEPAIAHLLEPPFDAVGVPEALVHPIAFVIALTLATYLHMLIGEMIPKNIALAAPVATALALGPSLVALTRALRPVIFGVNAFANTLLRLLKVEPKDEVASVFTDDELVRLVKDSSEAGLLAPADGERLRDALELGTRPVGEVMVPLNRTVTVDLGITPRGWSGPRSPPASPGCPSSAPTTVCWATSTSRTPSVSRSAPRRCPRARCTPSSGSRSTPRSTTPSRRCGPPVRISPRSPGTGARSSVS